MAFGRTTIIVRWGERYLCMLGVMDTLRPQVRNVIHRLRAVGTKQLIMIPEIDQRVA
jgi:Cd2+/Zn2+-exporting ATPase